MLDADARQHLLQVAGGDARNVLNALELAVESTPPDETGAIHITLDVAQESIQKHAVLYDRDGDAHYDTISAFIKSVRGGDPDAALYWLAKMLVAGEDPRFILRRLIVLSGEDIGLADPLGIVVATSAATAFEYIGLPEGVYPIVEATLYLATAPKSNTAGSVLQGPRAGRANGPWACPDPPDGCQPGCGRSGPRKRLPVPARLPGALYPPAVPADPAPRHLFLRAIRPGV